MATLNKTYTFVPGVAVAAQVNQNFDDLVNFVNANCIQKDGSLAFTAIPSGPNSDPTSANQFTRKSYVDALVGAVPKAPLHYYYSTNLANGTASSFTAAISIPSIVVPNYNYTIAVKAIGRAGFAGADTRVSFKLQLPLGTDVTWGNGELDGGQVFIDTRASNWQSVAMMTQATKAAGTAAGFALVYSLPSGGNIYFDFGFEVVISPA